MRAVFQRRGVMTVAAGLIVMILAVAVYGRSRAFGLQSDDYHWIDGAHHFEAERLWTIEGRSHFYRPVMEVYFRAAVGVCDGAPRCLHSLSVAAHALTSVTVGAFVAALSGKLGLGFAAGAVFAAQPAPVEAVTWVSAVTEVLVTFFCVVAVWSHRRALDAERRLPYGLALLAVALALLTHESAIALAPLLGLSTPWPADRPQRTSAIIRALPFVGLFAGYAALAYVINSRNYVVTEGHYAIGPHMFGNMLQALASFAVARRDVLSLAALGGAVLATCLMATGRVRLWAAWTLVALLPVAPFHGDLPSRYLYLPAVGASALVAELLWWLREKAIRWGTASSIAWAVVAIAVVVRFAAFTARNVDIYASASLPYEAYARAIRADRPSLPAGATIDVPAPPDEVAVIHVQALLRWAYDDPALTVRVLPSQRAPPKPSP